MKALLKWAFGLILGTAALAVIAAAILLFAIDPNQYKPQLEQLAKDNNVELNIAGDLSWQLWPNVAISAADTRLNGTQLPEIQLKRADLSLELASLIKGELIIHKVALEEPLIRIELTDNNASQQACAIASAPVAAAGTNETDGSPLAIHSLAINNGTVELLQNGVLQQRVDNLNISGQQINLDNREFPIDIAFTSAIPGVAEQASLQFSAQVRNNQLQQIALNNASASLTVASQAYGDHQLVAQFSAELDINKDHLSLPKASLQLDDIPLTLSANIQQLSETPNIIGTLKLPAVNPSPLLAKLGTDNPIKRLEIDTDFAIQGNRYQLDNLALVLDDFSLSGNFSANLAQQREIKGVFKGTTLNLDKYVSAESDTGNQTNQTLFAPLLAPLALLQGGKGQIEITLDKLIAQEIELDDLYIDIIGNGPVIYVSDFFAKGFGGDLAAHATLDLSAAPSVKIKAVANSADIEQVLKAVADYEEFGGQGNLAFIGTSSGHTADELLANLKGDGTFSLEKPTYNALNIEQQLCAVAGDKNQQPATWPEGSRLNKTSSQFTINGETLTLNNLLTGVGNIILRGKGNLKLQQGLMDMHTTINIHSSKSSEQGCVLRSKSIQNRDIPLHLQGPVAEINSVMSNALVDLMARTLLEGKTNRLLNKLLGGDEQSEQGEQTTEDSQPKDSKDQLKDLLKDLLKKR